MDYVLEDIEVMRKELVSWRSEAASHESALSDESRYASAVCTFLSLSLSLSLSPISLAFATRV
jgi:hypothetical protein